MRVRSELAYAMRVHASRVLLLAIKTPSEHHRDNLLCLNIAAHVSLAEHVRVLPARILRTMFMSASCTYMFGL